MNLKRVMGCDADGIWHYAPTSYSTTIDTKCGRTQLRVIAFAMEDNPAIKNICERCEGKLKAPRLGYPAGWPLCNCGEPVMDGKATCGRVECL